MTCRICGAPSSPVFAYDISPVQTFWRDRGVSPEIAIRRCSRYGSYFTETVPAPDMLASQYGSTGDVEDYFADKDRDPTRRARRLVSTLRRFVDRGSVLDVGGGDGTFALQAAAAGYDSWMFEVSPPKSSRLADAGVRVVSSLEGLPAFDAITAWDVYEHVWPQADFLAPLVRALKPTGRLLMEIPSPSRLVPVFLGLARRSKSPRREKFAAQVCNYTHLQLMTPPELRFDLPRHGLEVVKIERYCELAFRGVEYARRILPGPLATVVGAMFDQPAIRRFLLGANKTLAVARRS